MPVRVTPQGFTAFVLNSATNRWVKEIPEDAFPLLGLGVTVQPGTTIGDVLDAVERQPDLFDFLGRYLGADLTCIHEQQRHSEPLMITFTDTSTFTDDLTRDEFDALPARVCHPSRLEIWQFTAYCGDEDEADETPCVVRGTMEFWTTDNPDESCRSEETDPDRRGVRDVEIAINPQQRIDDEPTDYAPDLTLLELLGAVYKHLAVSLGPGLTNPYTNTPEEQEMWDRMADEREFIDAVREGLSGHQLSVRFSMSRDEVITMMTDLLNRGRLTVSDLYGESQE